MFARNTVSAGYGATTGVRDDTLDRSYDYDQVGRLIVAHTGYEARLHLNRQQAGDSTNYGAYSQAYNYDAQGNMTTRVGWGGWNGGYVNWTPQYSNNRLTTNPATGQPMSYDAAGNLTSNGAGASYQYDATGQQVAAGSLTMNYDGAGLRVKKTESGAATYYLRSSVLGGQVACELTSYGGFQRGYVYAGSQVLAVQQNNAVSWVAQDPVTKSQRITALNGTVTSVIDVDPWGGETSKSSQQAFQPHCFISTSETKFSGIEHSQR